MNIITQALPLMASEVVLRTQALLPKSPLARLKFWYYDTCAPSCYLLGHALTFEERNRIVATSGINAGSDLWHSEGSIEIAVGLGNASPCRDIFATAYAVMSMDSGERLAAGYPAETEEMSRLLAQALSRHLNALDWSEICPVTDDFVVYAQNGTDYGCNCYEDFILSVPIQKQQLLRARGLIGDEPYYFHVSAAENRG